jgi:predicted nucleic acid-binding protein
MIDTSTLLSAYLEEKNQDIAEELVNGCSYSYNGFISIITVGEFIRKMFEYVKDRQRRKFIFEEFSKKLEKFNIVSIDKNIMDIVKSWEETGIYFHGKSMHDTIIVATGVWTKCSLCITVDNSFYECADKISRFSHDYSGIRMKIELLRNLG